MPFLAPFRRAVSAFRSSYTGPAWSGGWLPWIVNEPFAGAWQRNITVDRSSVLAFHAVYSCVTLIASDICKLRVKLVQQQDATRIWQETNNPAYSPVLRRPNHYQNRIQFWESWILSKLLTGNVYVLKERDNRNVVVGLYVLDPARCRPLVADSGDVFYELSADNLSGLPDAITVPAREIIHDRWNCLYHSLCGMSPIFAAGLSATQGLQIQTTSARFFENDARPGGILTAPGNIPKEQVQSLKDQWESNYSGANRGKIAVLGSGLKFDGLSVTAEDSQLIEQLKWTAEVVCSCFHVPPYKIGVGQMPAYNNIQALNVEYYSQCLQRLIEDAELCLDEGLAMVDAGYGAEFDLDGLLRMDSVTLAQTLKEAVGAAIMAPDEARAKLDLPPVKGGASPLAQQQNFSLAALAKRDAKDDPFATTPAKPTPSEPPAAAPSEADAAAQRRAIDGLIGRHFELAAAA